MQCDHTFQMLAKPSMLSALMSRLLSWIWGGSSPSRRTTAGALTSSTGTGPCPCIHIVFQTMKSIKILPYSLGLIRRLPMPCTCGCVHGLLSTLKHEEMDLSPQHSVF